MMAMIPLATALETPAADVLERAAVAAERALRQQKRYLPKFFTPHEWHTVRLLVDLIIPRDERSGSATDAGVPEFMDFMMLDRPSMQTSMRGGLRWLDAESGERFGKPFVELVPEQRSAILDDIAWPAKARKELSHGVAFFNSFRDLTASGFWSSKMGVADLRYMGNTYVVEWNGCPDEALKHLGVSYDDLKAAQ
ncbi:MAG: gluconate 2-dehydrogenase subunit 3 family protein [Gemmatimonadetes bacterium]|nr:gluconate 2-dehydrogenase subunit 3 family protein [Gemmatimonadota bacterium]